MPMLTALLVGSVLLHAAAAVPVLGPRAAGSLIEPSLPYPESLANVTFTNAYLRQRAAEKTLPRVELYDRSRQVHYRGVLDRGVEKYRGIDYALPPVGELRWRAPVPKVYKKTTVNAEFWGKTCPQIYKTNSLFGTLYAEALGNVSVTSEDCLSLNVFTPKASLRPAYGRGLPVLVYIYGGNFDSGSTDYGGIYDGDGLVRQAGNNVVVVSMNYRVSILGFGFTPEMLNNTGFPESEGYGNYGILDQRLALQWIQKNIAVFGGDPKKVTLFGQSAGAGSVDLHTLLPASNNLFHRAILQSGTIETVFPVTREVAFERFALIADKVGCPAGPNRIACMRSKKPSELFAVAGGPGQIVWRPVLDGIIIPTDLKERARANNTRNPSVKSYLLSVAADEGSVFSPPASSRADFDAILSGAGFPTAVLDILAQLYSPELTGSWAKAIIRVVSDSFFDCNVYRLARTLTVPTYLIRYAQTNAAWSSISSIAENLGAAHSIDLGSVFGQTLFLINEGERFVSRTHSKAWAKFASSAPGVSPLAGWPRFNGTASPNAWTFINGTSVPTTEFAPDSIAKTRCSIFDQ